MSNVTIHDLRNHTRAVLDRANAGETITITVDGRPTAELRGIGARPTTMSRDLFMSTVLATQADPGLAGELAELAPDTTDDIAW